jgi:hypothetical protein
LQQKLFKHEVIPGSEEAESSRPAFLWQGNGDDPCQDRDQRTLWLHRVSSSTKEQPTNVAKQTMDFQQSTGQDLLQLAVEIFEVSKAGSQNRTSFF